MKLDATKLILILVAALQSLIIYIGRDIQLRINNIEFKMDTEAKSGGYDSIADYMADKDSLTGAERKYLEYILERSE